MEKAAKTNTVHHNGYVAGWLNSSIDDFLTTFPRGSENAAFALITCLDSNVDPNLLIKRDSVLRAALNGVTHLRRGLLMPSKLLHKASLRSRLFFGFDEIWFFPTSDVEPKPDAVSIVGPNRIAQTTLDRLGPWMDRNGCSLALGDGAGLNIVVKAYGLAKHVIAHSLLQLPPALQMNEMWVENEEKLESPVSRGKRTRVVSL